MLTVDSCDMHDAIAGPVPDDRVVQMCVEHWGFPGGDGATVTWEPVRVGGDIVAGSTCGIWRARVTSPSASISVVIKILHLADTGSRFWPASEVPSAPMYWRREADALLSPELAGLPGPFQAGRCRATYEPGDHHLELWLDDQLGEPGSAWDLGRLTLAARHLGETQGAIAAEGPVAAPWWSRGWLRAYAGRREIDTAMLVEPALWKLPYVREHYDPGVGPALAEIWTERERLLDLLDRVPYTLCHMDLWPPNLFSHPDPALADAYTIAIDWGFAGQGSVGEDIANLIPDSVQDGFVPPADAFAFTENVFDAYIEGLRRGGSTLDPRIVRFVYGAAMAVKYAWMTPRMLEYALKITHCPEIEAIDGMPLDEAFAARAASASVMARLGIDALSLVDLIGALG